MKATFRTVFNCHTSRGVALNNAAAVTAEQQPFQQPLRQQVFAGSPLGAAGPGPMAVVLGLFQGPALVCGVPGSPEPWGEQRC